MLRHCSAQITDSDKHNRGKESRVISAADDVMLQTWGGTERMNRAGALKREGREEEREQSEVELKSSLRKCCL